MNNKEYKQCPNCGKEAYGEEEIEELFGYRYNGTKPQSWCRECRSSGGNEKLSKEEAALIWASNGKDEDYTFGYDEEELEEALQ